MPKSGIMLPATKHLTPYQQGYVSSLCGLYAVLNGIQLVLWPHRKLRRWELKRGFSSGVQHLHSSGILASVMHEGIEDDSWLELSRTLIRQTNALTGLCISRRFILQGRAGLTGRSAITLIKQQLRSQKPVLVTLSGALGHATVIVGYDRDRLMLFDSSGFKWIMASSIGLLHPSSSKRHQVSKRTVLALSLARPA